MNFSAKCLSRLIKSTNPTRTANRRLITPLRNQRRLRRIRWAWPRRFSCTWHPASSCSSSSQRSYSHITRAGPTISRFITPSSHSRPSVLAISWRVIILSYRFSDMRGMWLIVFNIKILFITAWRVAKLRALKTLLRNAMSIFAFNGVLFIYIIHNIYLWHNDKI